MTRSKCRAMPNKTKDNARACTSNGCRRNKRYGALCDVHQSADPDEAPSIPLPARVASGPNLSSILPVLTLDGFAYRVLLDDASLAALQREVDPIYISDCRKCRDVVRFDSAVLTDIVATIAAQHPVELGGFMPMLPQGEALIVAAPFSQRTPSEQIKLGPMHRDTARGDAGYLTMLAFMDEVTADNGSITVYQVLESQDIPC
jgi:hypothetical protein